MAPSTSFIALCGLFVHCTLTSAYTLTSSYDHTNWYTSFTWHNEPDPTKGTVEYISLAEAQSSGLTKIVNNQVYMSVDNTTVIDASSTSGRKSNWITSNKPFTHGLLIGDFAHIPGSTCGAWPSFWTINDNLGGEIDILESFSDNTQNYALATLHTQPEHNCTFQAPADTQIGTPNNDDYDCTLPASGCSVTGPAGSFGDPFNANKGGVYAMDWTSTYIRIYFFARANIPADITSGKPDPTKWGLPMANFDSKYGSCDVGASFPEQTIYFDTTFCGAEAGTSSGSWAKWTDCAKTTGVSTCEAYVRQQPEKFDTAYWLINSVKVYQ
ncbi:putative endo-1,3(4)-beta-glucanase [Lachnellula subtilissima]|uniref:Putative endo-1,3(4)-beta-glucanase n=1 Tax=Lachnellula subtilissima TaxID=602034 RepID=A0A8H8UAU4_9HELO|nr:putative endo-1,3(4)-beta-glucanase [Lachnellula subtilissima]